MPGRTPRDAFGVFRDALQSIISCIAHAKITVSPHGQYLHGAVHSLSVNNNKPIPLAPDVLLRIRMQYSIIEDKEREDGPWRVTTKAYDYELQDSEGETIVAWHWHPETRSYPHTHTGRTQLARDALLSRKHHVPSGRVSLESVIRFCIEEFGAKALRDDWRDVLDSTETPFRLYRSWG